MIRPHPPPPQDLAQAPAARTGGAPRPRCGSTSRSRPRATPTRPAYVFFGRALSFRELQRAGRGAGRLAASAGVRAGDRVLLFMQNCPQFVVAFYGILRADAVVVPVNPMNRADEFSHYITDPQARVVICTRRPGRHRGRRPTRALPDGAAPAARAGDALHRRDARRRARRRPRRRAPAIAGLAARRPAAARRRTCAGPTRWPPACRPARTPRGPTTWRCCPTPRAPPACPRAACTPTAR